MIEQINQILFQKRGIDKFNDASTTMYSKGVSTFAFNKKLVDPYPPQ